MKLPRAHLASKRRQIDNNLLPRPAQRVRQKQHIPFRILFECDLCKLANLAELGIFGPATNGLLFPTRHATLASPLSYSLVVGTKLT